MSTQSEPQGPAGHQDLTSTSETLKLSLTRDYVPGAAPAAGEPLPLRDGSRFRVRRFHAQGGLGTVSIADDQELQRSVAFKQIKPSQADNAHSRRRFLLEAEITGKLEHPGVVPVYGLVADDQGQPAYAMRFIQGETLADAMRAFHDEVGRMDDAASRREAFASAKFRQLLTRFVSFCNTIAFAHSRGIIHRDIKPANLMLGGYGESLVLDWGLARPFDHRTGVDPQDFSAEDRLRPTLGSSDGNETATGDALGTPSFMAPEQAEGHWDAVGPASDVYSLGATLYSLLTGAKPFEGKLLDVLDAVRQGNFTPPRQVNALVPRALEATCLRAMALRSQQRYASALELAQDVERYLADEPVLAYREPATDRLRRWARRRRKALVAYTMSAIIVLVTVTAGAWIVSIERIRREAVTRGLERQEPFNSIAVVRGSVDRYQQLHEAAFRMVAQLGQEPVSDRAELAPLRKEVFQSAIDFWDQAMRITQQSGETIHRRPGEVAYDLGRACAIEATAAREKEKERLANCYAQRAVEFLREAGNAGFFKEPGCRERLDSDPDFITLRTHEDFRDLLQKLAAQVADPATEQNKKERIEQKATEGAEEDTAPRP
jgi:serine/threonine protein kinase